MINSKKTKGKLDFYKYLFFLNKNHGITLLLNMLIFSISLITMIFSIIDIEGLQFTNIFAIIVFVFSLFNIIWDTIGKYQEIKSFAGVDQEIVMNKKLIVAKDDNVFKIDDICCSLEEEEWNFENCSLKGSQNDRVIFSKELNEYLWDSNFKLEKNTNKGKKVKEFILKNREIITPFFQYKYYNSKKNRQYFFNQDKLCMSSDIIRGKEFIQCHKGTYYDSFLTNEICMATLERREDSVIIYDASNFFPCNYDKEDGKYCLESITKSRMNNHIGISTLAYTKDNYFVIRMQGLKTQYNKEQYVPTGSGSYDWNDIRDNDFNKTICYAMQRELWEENGDYNIAPSPGQVGETRILGYFRWLRRGGKPEFVGITRLNYNLDSLKENTEELKDIHSSTIEDEIYLINVNDIPKFIDKIISNEKMSVPLEMCLKALKIYYEKRPNELKEFLRI
ncbi:hypothetical protein [Clostridium cochlearium]|nr:hypothetical protein [Clostridium cochlearium]